MLREGESENPALTYRAVKLASRFDTKLASCSGGRKVIGDDKSENYQSFTFQTLVILDATGIYDSTSS
jgi:hypothetical protein